MHLPVTPAILILFAPFLLWAVLFVLAEYGNVSLKPLTPWLAVACWLLWLISAILFLADRPWGSALISGYAGIVLVLGWVKRSYLFESRIKPSNSLVSLLAVSQPTYVAVRDIANAAPWYAEKFGLRKLAAAEQAQSDGATLQFNENTHPVILILKDPVAPRPAPVFFTHKVGKVRDALIARGVNAGPVQQDRQGTRFFELLDGEGNTIEVSERP